MKASLLTLFLFFGHSIMAQEIKTYFDWQWKPCPPGKARFVSLATSTDSGWFVRDFFLATKKLQMRGLYKDSARKIRDGWFRYYYANEQLSSAGQYVNNKREGLWVEYHPNGMMSDSAVFVHDRYTKRLGWHANGYLSDSSVRRDDGFFVHAYWFDNGNPKEAGKTLLGKKQGKWKYFHKNGKLASLEDYESDVLISKQYYDEEGNALTDTTNRDSKAEFRGSEKKWKAYVLDNLRFPENVSLVNTDLITVVVTAVIDEEGNVKDAYVEIPFHPLFDEEALRVMKKSPKWSPAISHNRKVMQGIRQPISFGQHQ